MRTSGIYLNLAMSFEPRFTDEIWRNVMELKREDDYREFLEGKTQLSGDFGFTPLLMPDALFDFQSYLTEWAIKRGRAALFSDCGTGKTLMQLVWGDNVRRHTNKNLLLITPIAVGAQTAEEAAKFGIDAQISRDGKPKAGITITNYERLHLFNQDDYIGVICDESSAIKNFQGKHRAIVTEFLRRMPYRLLCTATAAPNDYIELGTSSEALGELGYVDMLNRFFKNDEQNSGQGRVFGKGRTWRFKGHAEQAFWRWMSSWARAMRKPSDYGFSDHGFILPALNEREHIVRAQKLRDGFLFEMPAKGPDEVRDEERRTMTERCEKVAELAGTGKPVVVWCNLNEESALLAKMMPDLVEVSGSDSMERKEEVFNGFSKGQIRGIITKAKIGAWGMNWQHCDHTILFPAYSYEQYYQLVRRFWRFGQPSPVQVDVVSTEGGHDVIEALKRKSEQADRMFTALVEYMNQAIEIKKEITSINVEVPSWL